MQEIITVKELHQYEACFEHRALERLQSGRLEAFEAGHRYTLCTFSIYDHRKAGAYPEKLTVYLDHEDLFFLCNARSFSRVQELAGHEDTNEHALWGFFQKLICHDMDYLEEMESEITDAELVAMVRYREEDLHKIIVYRKRLLRLKRYYEQLDYIFDCLIANENHLLTEEGIRHFQAFVNRVQRYLGSVLNLRDYVTQMREACQAQLDIEQNNLMRIFTVVTTIFLPLTLMVGWYGMNFAGMPELESPYAYPVFILGSIVVCVGLLAYFKKKKWI